jgi:hypothetical protein
MAGFSDRVRKLVRTRAGSGDLFVATCEACGIWLGEHGGQIQHVVARGMGGTSNPVLSTLANATLLCGTAQTGDHGRAERRDPEMRDRGFWLPQGTDPRLMPMTLFGGVVVWRSETEPRYLYEPPAEEAA